MMLGKIYALGVGPGDPELITLKAFKILEKTNILFYHHAKGKQSQALRIVEPWLKEHHILHPLTYPLTQEKNPDSAAYIEEMKNFYDQNIAAIKSFVQKGQDVCILAEGDPLLYSSFMYIYVRLHSICAFEIIPAVSSISAAAAALKVPLCYRNQRFTIVPATLKKEDLLKTLNKQDAFAILKLGQNMKKIYEALEEGDLLSNALYIEYASMENEKILPLSSMRDKVAPYFSMILVPGQAQKNKAI